MLGVDPIKNLVVPRFLALMLITGLLNVYALLFGIVANLDMSAHRKILTQRETLEAVVG